MEAIRVILHVPFWCSFRQMNGVNVHTTYPIPPKSACYGLIANALGFAQDDYSLRDDLDFSICLLQEGEKVESFSTILKKARDEIHEFYTSLVVKQKLIQPKFLLYITSKEEAIRQQVYEALQNPERILYLGESDDMVELEDIQKIELQEEESHLIHSSLPVSQALVVNDSRLFKMPVKFEEMKKGQYFLIQEVVYVNQQLELDEPISCLKDSEYEKYLVFSE